MIMTEQKTSARTVTGKVTSIKMDKTIVVEVERRIKHKLGKYIRRSSKMYAHDSENTCGVGDVVIIQECRPLSKTKNWNLIQVVERVEKDTA